MVQFLLAMAILPGLFLIYKVYRLDKIEPEPLNYLAGLIAAGVFSTFGALILENIGDGLLAFLPFEDGTAPYYLVECFLVVAVSEELCKFIVLKGTLTNANFDYTFDGVVYGVCVGGGFAIFENILYVMDSPDALGTAIVRALTAVPGHLIFGIFMGYYLGQARYCIGHGDEAGADRNKRFALLLPVLLHGFYDFCAFMNSAVFALIFYVFVISMEISAFRKIRRYAQEDKKVDYDPFEGMSFRW